nr:MAG TPA: hypothetical protein [Caudoviricetes sp.]
MLHHHRTTNYRYHTLPGMMLARTYQIRTSLYTSCQLFLGQYESHQYR